MRIIGHGLFGLFGQVGRIGLFGRIGRIGQIPKSNPSNNIASIAFTGSHSPEYAIFYKFQGKDRKGNSS